MGNLCVSHRKIKIKSIIKAGEGNLRSLKFIKRIQTNKFSRIWLVQSENNKTLRALKMTDKVKLCQQHCTDLPINELNILRRLRHPFIVNIVSAFQDEYSLYILLEYMPYGNLRKYMNLQGLLQEQNAQFFAKCIFLALQYLHKKGIAHLDLKPQNILIDEDRYLRICDFNLSQSISQANNNYKIKGTPGYKPPEAFDQNQKVGFQADYFTTGVIIFELLTGKNFPNPNAISPSDILRDLLKVPKISQNCLDFIQGLLEKNPSQRLGSNGIQEILAHPWVSMTEHENYLFNKKMLPSFVNQSYISKYNSSLNQCQTEPESLDDSDEIVRSIFIQQLKFQKIFHDFKTIEESQYLQFS